TSAPRRPGWTAPVWWATQPHPAVRASPGASDRNQQARPRRRMIVEPLHRGDRLERRKPVADQRRWPGNGHEVVEGEPDEEDQGRGIGDDQRPALFRLVPHEEDDEQCDRGNETDD